MLQRERENSGLYHSSIKDERRDEGGTGFLIFIFFPFPFLYFINSASPSENMEAGVSFRVDTDTLETATLSLLSRKNYFIRLALWRIIRFLFPLFIFWEHVDSSKEKRSEDMRDKDVGSFLFCKDAISLLRVQGYASEAVSCLCSLFCIWCFMANYAPRRKL